MNVQPVFDSEKVAEITFSEDCRINVLDQTVLDQVAINIRRGLPQVCPHQVNSERVLLVCGGPSLKSTEKDLRDMFWDGGKIITVNAAYQWCIDRNLRPSAAVLMDARPFNARFLETPVKGCQYLLASQCHPTAFELCRNRQTLIWHALSAGEDELALLDEYYLGREHHHGITLGTTVGIRAISLMRMLGFVKFEIFGMDSCMLDGEHHAFPQEENNKDRFLTVWLRPQGRDDLVQRFTCTVWQAKQFSDALQLIQERGELFHLNFHGPGLIATAMRIGSQIEVEMTPPLPETMPDVLLPASEPQQ